MRTTGEGSVGLVVLASNPGDEVVSGAAEALRRASATYAWIVARGTLREAMIVSGEERVVPGPLHFASASGSYRAGDDAIDLTAMVVTQAGETIGGRFAMAVAEDVELICFVAAPRPAVGEQPAARVAPASPSAPATSSGGVIELGPSTREPTPRPPAPAPSDPGITPAGGGIAVIPQKLARKVEVEAALVEPEAGDRVTHFAFGDCDVESSDGDRIRLKQDKDDRVREVSLAMLRIEPPTVLENGKRHFRLLRKN